MPELQRLHQSDVLLLLAAINDVQPLQAFRAFTHDYFSRPVNEVIKPLHRDLQDIVFGVVRNADQGEASGLHSITEGQALDFDQSPLACQALRDRVEIALPLGNLQCSRRIHSALIDPFTRHFFDAYQVNNLSAARWSAGMSKLETSP
jgi:hypothetical protein